MSQTKAPRTGRAAFPNVPETPIMPEVEESLQVIVPMLTASKNLVVASPSTWRIVIGGRDYRMHCSTNLERIRLWAYDDGLRWNLQIRATWNNGFDEPYFFVMDRARIVAAQGDPKEIMDDLLVLRLAV